ncbi:hypothetical protein BTR23_05000 [Alkalihalophilus pseudofirmus]|nr:hypothetical protein BTR23_05000 [Alkalihalophilus pseudofirmus]
MHTIVIHLQDQPQDWHLIEPFFYKAQSSGLLSFFQCKPNFNREDDIETVYNDIIHHLIQQRISHWNFVVMMYIPSPMYSNKRLTVQLNQIKETWLRKFTDHDMSPQTVTALILDPLRRDSVEAPEDGISHSYWQIDNFGYFHDEEKIENPQNMFVASELTELNEIWGNPINLQEAGLLEKPNTSFLELLFDKRTRVIDRFQTLIHEKKRYAENLEIEPVLHKENVLSTEMLTEIEEMFVNQVTTMLQKRPLPKEIDAFSPGQLLENILKEKIALPSVISDFRVIRQLSSIHSVERRTKALLSVALFINAITTTNEFIKKLPKGTTYELLTVVNDAELEQLLSDYSASLQTAATKVENQILQRKSIMKRRFEPIKVTPHTANFLTEPDFSVPPFKVRNQKTYYQTWEVFVQEVEEELQRRERSMLREAAKGADVLSVIKRQKPITRDEQVDLHEYMEELQQQMDVIYSELEEIGPGVSELDSSWETYAEKANFEMDIHVKASPTKKQVAVALSLSMLFLLGPHLYVQNWEFLLFQEKWLDFLVIPLLTAIAVLSCGYIVKQKMVKPIEKIISITKSEKKKLYDEQLSRQSQYNQYLNKLYELYRTRQQYFLIKEEYDKEKRENSLYRYHLSEIQDYLESCENLIRNLGLLVYQENQNSYHHFDAKFKVTKNIENNPIYSPFDCVSSTVQKNNSFDLHIGQKKSTYNSGYLTVLERLKFEKDQVYKL